MGLYEAAAKIIQEIRVEPFREPLALGCPDEWLEMGHPAWYLDIVEEQRFSDSLLRTEDTAQDAEVNIYLIVDEQNFADQEPIMKSIIRVVKSICDLFHTKNEEQVFAEDGGVGSSVYVKRVRYHQRPGQTWAAAKLQLSVQGYDD